MVMDMGAKMMSPWKNELRILRRNVFVSIILFLQK